MSKIKLSIIIVNYNSGDFIIKSLDSLFLNYKKELEEKEFEIIVVDNNSSDQSLSKLEKVREINLIKNSQNLGFSKANNIGVKKSSGEFILFLNPDTTVPAQTLRKMIEFMNSNNHAGAASCKLILGNGTEDGDAHRGFPTPWNALTQFSGLSKIFPKTRAFDGYYLGWKDFSKVQKVDSLVGAFMMVRREAGQEINWWDEDYFFYGEDIQFCFDLKTKGWEIYYVPSCLINHFKGISSGIKRVSKDISTANKETKKRATLARFNAMKVFINKNYKNKYNIFVRAFVNLAIDLKLFWALHF